MYKSWKVISKTILKTKNAYSFLLSMNQVDFRRADHGLQIKNHSVWKIFRKRSKVYYLLIEVKTKFNIEKHHKFRTENMENCKVEIEF